MKGITHSDKNTENDQHPTCSQELLEAKTRVNIGIHQTETNSAPNECDVAPCLLEVFANTFAIMILNAEKMSVLRLSFFHCHPVAKKSTNGALKNISGQTNPYLKPKTQKAMAAVVYRQLQTLITAITYSGE